MPGEILSDAELNRHLYQSDPTPLADHQSGPSTDMDTIQQDQQNGPQ